LALPENRKATEGDVAGAIKYATLVNGEWVASISASMISFIRRLGVADTTMEDGLRPGLREAINANVDQSINDIFEDHIPPALELMIETAVTNALTAALPNALAAALPNALAAALPNALAAAFPPLLAPMDAKLTRVVNEQKDMSATLTRVEIIQAKVLSVEILHICCQIINLNFTRCLINHKAVGQAYDT
jgi:hypothetical protein